MPAHCAGPKGATVQDGSISVRNRSGVGIAARAVLLMCALSLPAQAHAATDHKDRRDSASPSRVAQVRCTWQPVQCQLQGRNVSRTRRASNVTVQMREVWRFDLVAKQWRSVALRSQPLIVLIPEAAKSASPTQGTLLYVVPGETGLYLLRWSENDRLLSELAYVGAVGCNDVMLPPAPPGMFATCVPSARLGIAMYVPNPPDARRANE